MSLVQWLYCNTALPISLTWSQYTKVYCDTMALPSLPPGHDTASVLLPKASCSLQYNPAYLQYKFSSQLAISCNTLPLLQYNPLPKRLSHNTIWAVAQIGLHIFIYLFISSYWKTLKKYIPFFFSFVFPKYSNKFIKI